VTALLRSLRAPAIVGVAALSAGLAGGWQARDVIAERSEARWRQLAAEDQSNQLRTSLRQSIDAGRVSADIGARSSARQVEIRTVTNEIIRETPIYVSEASDFACLVPLGFLRLHDDAAAGRASPVPDPAAPPHDAASGVELSDVARTVTHNYGACHSDAERLRSLQDWVREQAAIWNGNIGDAAAVVAQ
jgi:hypothetical protein